MTGLMAIAVPSGSDVDDTARTRHSTADRKCGGGERREARMRAALTRQRLQAWRRVAKGGVAKEPTDAARR